ncbi:MAG: DUF1385 domain-containing protein [Candidatus Dormibacteraeota bacterium]|nr:DUF1385 domain-containing protein [Candidatus Dormibacteraeota bacterium]MBO0762319.1 DUF1385 domain-containing protein [Candidatus Dormibacteraeota bacterium]
MSSTAGSPRPFFYGGQAVVEGVMMRGPQHYAVAVRLPKGGVRVERGELRGHLYTHPVWRLPFLRGLAVLAEQLHLGMRCLVWSAAVNAGEQDIQIGKREVVASLVVGILFSVLLFIGLPLLGAGIAVQRSNSFWFVVVEGVIRIFLVLGYLSLIGMLRDVRRVFQYHGAEHKTINALEQGWDLEPASVRRASTLHPRCGTGFLLVVLVVSVLVFSLVAIAHPNWLGLIGSRIVGIPVIAAVSYEWIRFLAGRARTRVGAALLVPVLLTQRFTTREPDDSMLEVAIAALRGAMQTPAPEVRSAEVRSAGEAGS